jgi:hypothetical protein
MAASVAAHVFVPATASLRWNSFVPYRNASARTTAMTAVSGPAKAVLAEALPDGASFSVISA